MKKLRLLLLPVLLILGLASVASVAQTINKALQLSQDATGAFGVDTTNNVYFPGHILNTGNAGPPATVSAGGTAATLVGTDVAGQITLSAAATTATVTFGRAYVTAPICVVASPAAAGTTSISWTTVTTSLAITASGAVGTTNKPTYICTSSS